jgi:outer membrane biosynthesis protein TonB
MKTLWIAASLCLLSTAALAQSASKTVLSLDICFKLVRVAEANCSTPTDDAAQRRECLQNARKVQLECLELAGAQAPAPIGRQMATAEAASSNKPVEAASSERPVQAVAPVVPANPTDKPAEPEKPVEATPSPLVMPAPPVTVTESTSMPPAKAVEAAPPVSVTASTRAPTNAPGTNWTVSEMSSPVDYAPIVTATLRARSENRIAPAALVIRCRGGRNELWLRMEGIPRPSRGNEILVAQQLNDQPTVKSRWTAAADAKTAVYKGDPTALLLSLSEDTRLRIVVSDGAGRDSEAVFQFAGWNAIRDKIATACMWTSTATASKPSERR